MSTGEPSGVRKRKEYPQQEPVTPRQEPVNREWCGDEDRVSSSYKQLIAKKRRLAQVNLKVVTL